MKRAGYDMDAGAKRLQDLLDKQKKEREEREMNSTKSEEASPMIKPPKNEFGKKEDAFAHVRKHGGRVMKKTFIHPTSGMKTVSYVVREDTEVAEAIKKPNATTRHLRDYPVSDKDVAKPVKPEKKKDEKKAVAEGKEDLHAQLQAINQKLKLMKGGPVGEPNSLAFVGKRKALLKQKEQILSQLKQGVAEGVGGWSGPLYDPALQGNGKKQRYEMMFKNGQVKRFSAMNDNEARKIAAGHGAKSVIKMKGNVPGDKIAEQGVAEGIMKSLASRLVKGAANRQTPQEIANTHVRALNQRAPGTRMQGHPNFADFKREVHSYISAAQNGEQAFARTTDDHVKSLFKKYFSEGVAEAAFKDPSPMMKDDIKQDKIRSLNNLIAIAKVKGVHHKVKEYELELKKLKETTEVTEAGPFSYGAKPPRKGSVAYNAMMQRKEQDKKRVKEIEAIGTKNHHIGIAKVTKEEVEVNESDMYTYIDQTKGPVLRGKTGTFVGYTHSTSKGKGANILKHNKTGKYYAAGGSSTAFTQKTTLHDTPQAAAKAYHKGNLAEVLNVGKSFKDLREAAFHSNCCPDEEYGFTEEEFTVTGTEQYEDWGDDMVEGKLSFTRLTQKLHEEDGKNVKLNKPFLTPGGPKKRAVYVKNDKGNTVKVNFGDPNLEIKRDDPERRSSFRARHNCDNPGPKWKARYWSCKFWSSTPVSKL